MNILNESQSDRDIELSLLTNTPLEKIQALKIASPDSIRIFDGENPPEDLTSLYKTYDHLNFLAYLKTLMERSVKSRHSELFKLLRETKGKKCLDFGSGVGSHSIALAENGNDVTMLDVRCSELIHFASKRFFHRQLSFDILYHDDEIPNNYFDVVIATDVMEHIEDCLIELKRIYKSMKFGGIFHCLTSTMVKPSSGHFKFSIDRWKAVGIPFMKENFIEVRPTIWRKK